VLLTHAIAVFDRLRALPLERRVRVAVAPVGAHAKHFVAARHRAIGAVVSPILEPPLIHEHAAGIEDGAAPSVEVIDDALELDLTHRGSRARPTGCR
jgi:hypothetical protein